MSLYKRGSTFWVRFTTGGRRVHKSTATSDRARAEQYHDKVKAEIWAQLRLGKRPTHTWNDAVVRWLQEVDHKATAEKDKQILRWMHPYLNGMQLEQISLDLIEAIREKKARTTSKSMQIETWPWSERS